MFKKIFFTKNVGNLDRIIRLLLPAVIVAVLWYTDIISGPLEIGLWILAGMLAFTSVTGTCSIYGILGVCTRKKP